LSLRIEYPPEVLVVSRKSDTAHETALVDFTLNNLGCRKAAGKRTGNLNGDRAAQVGFVCCIFDAFIYW